MSAADRQIVAYAAIESCGCVLGACSAGPLEKHCKEMLAEWTRRGTRLEPRYEPVDVPVPCVEHAAERAAKAEGR